MKLSRNAGCSIVVMLYGQFEGDAEKLKLLKALWQYAQEIV